MNSIFFRNNASALNQESSFDIDLSPFTANDIMSDGSFCAFKDELSSDYVLMQDEISTAQSFNKKGFDCNRLNPFYNTKQQSVLNLQNTPNLRGFLSAHSYTDSVRRLSVQTARFTLHHLGELSTSLNTLKQNAPNQTTKNTISNLNTQVFVMRGIMQNIIRQLTNNPGINFNEPVSKMQNKNFCTELTHTLSHADQSQKGLIRLSRLVNIPNINRQIFIMQITLNNIINTLNGFKSYC